MTRGPGATFGPRIVSESALMDRDLKDRAVFLVAALMFAILIVLNLVL